MDKLEEIEFQLLLEGIFLHYGYDFRNYSAKSLTRRIWQCMAEEKVTSISGFQDMVLHEPACMDRLLHALSINVTAMFRDPEFYRVFRTEVLPWLRTYPFIRIWHAGCASGEEVYSMAILLEEEGMYDRCRIYGTDINQAALGQARAGVFPLAAMQTNTTNYLQSGGQGAFSEYYTAKYDNALFRPALGRNMVFARHNLVTDSSFNEFNVILCRNVMIYFNKSLQGRVHQLFYQSLGMFGLLGLGSMESIKFTPHEHCYADFDSVNKLYRKRR